jgi:rubrerythrin
MIDADLERIRVQYGSEREARQKEFAQSPEGKKADETGAFFHVFAERERPHANKAEKEIKEVKRAKKEIAGKGTLDVKVLKKNLEEVKKKIEGIKAAPTKEVEKPDAEREARLKKIADLAAKVEEHRKRIEELKAAKIMGPRGGRYYISSSGEKVYMKSNPGAEVVGYMAALPFSGGLPAYVSEAEPCREAFAPNPNSTPLPKKG